MLDPTELREQSSWLGGPTLLFTDIEGSTRLLDLLGDDRYSELLGRHHELIRNALAQHGGTEQGTEGDSFFATFDTARDGVAAAVDAQQRLAEAAWPDGVEVRVRMGLHSGPVAVAGGSLVGMSIHAAARIEAAAHGGQIVVSAAVARQLGRWDGATLRSLGSHRLRGISERIELFQVDVPGRARDFPPLATEPSGTSPVPHSLAAFVGRDEELGQLRTLLERHRVVTITGPPGVGKTRLAAAVLDGQNDVAFVDLASLDDPTQVPDRVLAAVGLRRTGEEAADEVLIRHLGDVPFVLLLDNCEHVIDVVALLVADLAARTGALEVLATSREPLAVEGEVVWPLGALAQAEELFVSRVRAADATVALDPTDPRVVRICERLDRLPLAVELAAAQVGRMPIDEVVTRLDKLAGELRSGRRDAPSRHRTLRAAIDWSVRLLDEPERAAFRRLSVFRGPFDLATAEAVTGAPADVIATLHERSLLGVDSPGATGRFRMLQTVRAAAWELLDAAGESEDAARVHAQTFQKRAEVRLRDQPTHLATLRATDEDADDYRQAVEWLADHDPTGALALAVDLEALWTTRISPAVTRRLLAPLLDRATDAPPALRASALLMMADNDRNGGRAADARSAAQEAVELSGDAVTRDRFSAAIVLGQIVALQGELDEAARVFERSLRTARERRDVQGLVAVLREIANVAIERGRPQDAVEPLDEATDLALTDEASQWMLGILASDRARVALGLGDLDTARAEFEASLARGQELGVGRAVAGCSLGLAQVERRAGNHGAARALLLEAARFYRDQGDVGGLAHVYVETALQHAVTGAHERAVQLLAAAEATRTRIQIATPGSEEPSIREEWAAAAQVLGDGPVVRLARAGRAASPEELAALV